MKLDDDSGDPNSKVYDIVRVVDKHTLQISPPAVADGRSAYSIGRRSYAISASRIASFICSTLVAIVRCNDMSQPNKPGLTMPRSSTRMVVDSMKRSDADFFFVVSSVPMMVPHSGAAALSLMLRIKKEAWWPFKTNARSSCNFGFAWQARHGHDRRSSQQLLDQNHRPRLEFCCGPHNSVNHVPKLDEGDRPATGKYLSGTRECDIRCPATSCQISSARTMLSVLLRRPAQQRLQHAAEIAERAGLLILIRKSSSNISTAEPASWPIRKR